MSTYLTKMFDRLDRICDARYGTANNHVVEMILEKNPGLENEEILLTPGLTINLPDLKLNNDSAKLIQQIRLWD